MRRIIIYSVTLIVAVFTVLIAILAFYRQSLQQHALAFVVQQVEERCGCRLELDNVRIQFPFEVSIDQARLLSEDKTLAQAEQVRIAVDLWQLLRSHLVLHGFSAQKVTFYTGDRQRTVQLWGRLHVMPREQELTADLHFARIGEEHFAYTTAAIRLKQQNDQVALRVRLSEPADGWLSHAILQPKKYAFQLYMQAEGPWHTWQELLEGRYATLTNQLDGEFHLSYASQDNASIFGDAGSLMGAFHFAAPAGLQVSHLEGVAGPLLIQGAGVLSLLGTLDGTAIEVRPSSDGELERWLGVKTEAARLKCEISGELREPHLNLQMASDAIQWNNTAFKECGLQTHVACAQGGVNGSLNLHGQRDEEIYKLEAIIGWDFADKIRVQQLSAKLGDSEMKGEWECDLAHPHFDGYMTGEIAIQQFTPTAQGKVQFHLQPTLVEGVQQLTANLHIPAIQFERGFAEAVTLRATLVDPLAFTSGSVNLICEHCQWGTHACVDLNCDATIDSYAMSEFLLKKTHNGKGTFSLSTHGPQDRFVIQTSGRWEQADDQSYLTLNSLVGNVDHLPFSLLQPFTLHYGSAFELSPIQLSVASGSVITSFYSRDAEQRLLLEARAVPMKLFAKFNAHIPHQGIADLDINLTQSNGQVHGAMSGKLNDIFLFDFKDENSPVVIANFTANLHNARLEAAGHVTGLGPQPLEVTAQIPLTITLSPFYMNIPRDQPMAAYFSQEGKIESLLELLLPVSNTLISGETRLQFAIEGTLASPTVKGQCDLINGAFELPSLSIALRNVKLHANIHDKEVQLTHLSANGVTSGSLIGKGQIALDPAADFPFAFTISLDELAVTPFRNASFTANGGLNLRGDIKGGFLSGMIASESLNITVPDTLAELTKTVDVSYVNQPPDVAPPTRIIAQKSLWPLTLNLALDFPRKGMIQGRDWTSEWEGHLKLTGDMEHPQLNGTCKIIRGEYRFNGQPFQITEGTITLAGNPDKKTTLYVIASRDLGDIVAEIILKGPLKDPLVSFRSNPPHSQREIVSWILFGHGVSENTPFQGTQLSESIMHLNTTGSQPDALARFRNQLGVDRIDIVRDDTNDSNSVKVGKYISKGILVSVNKSVSEDANSVSIEASLMKNIKVQAEVNDEDAAQLQLKWKHDY